MKSPLRTTSGALVTGNQEKGATGKKGLRLRIKTVKQKKCRHKQDTHSDTQYKFGSFIHRGARKDIRNYTRWRSFR